MSGMKRLFTTIKAAQDGVRWTDYFYFYFLFLFLCVCLGARLVHIPLVDFGFTASIDTFLCFVRESH